MPSQETADLNARIAALEAENRALKANSAHSESDLQPKRAWRSVLAATLIFFGILLATVSVPVTYVKNQLTDTDFFVATLAPLADNPHVQAVIADTATDAINEALDVPKITSALFDGLAELELSPQALGTFQLLQAPINQGIESLIGGFVSDFVESKAFSTIWSFTLRTTHAQLVATLQSSPDTALAISDSGSLEIQLGPIIAEVRERLVTNGVGIAQMIPEINRSIVLVENEALRSVTTLYSLLVTVGTWLPWASLGLLIAGVFVANRRRKSLITTTIILGVVMAVPGAALAIGRTVVGGLFAAAPLTPDAIVAGFDAVTSHAAKTVAIISVISFAIAIVAWLTGPTRVPLKIGEGAKSFAGRFRKADDQDGR